jgi:pSer/pThr/pTyr-binding forkhead associated (FHA) protein
MLNLSRYLVNGQPPEKLDHAVLVLCNPPESVAPPPDPETRISQIPTQGSSEPIVYALRKAPRVAVAQKPEITLGRNDANDIILAGSSVSRFHACFEQTTTAWKLVDTGSTFGTWVNDERLTPHQAVAVPDGARLRFGEIGLLFFTPKGFMGYLKSL